MADAFDEVLRELVTALRANRKRMAGGVINQKPVALFGWYEHDIEQALRKAVAYVDGPVSPSNGVWVEWEHLCSQKGVRLLTIKDHRCRFCGMAEQDADEAAAGVALAAPDGTEAPNWLHDLEDTMRADNHAAMQRAMAENAAKRAADGVAPSDQGRTKLSDLRGLLRQDPDLNEEAAASLEAIFLAAYQRLKNSGT